MELFRAPVPKPSLLLANSDLGFSFYALPQTHNISPVE